AVTPIQMANVAASIARQGVWVRPRLICGDVKTSSYHPKKGGEEWDNIPDRVDLKLSPDGLRAARDGMIKVVNTRAGTGEEAKRHGCRRQDRHGRGGAVSSATNRSGDRPAAARRRRESRLRHCRAEHSRPRESGRAMVSRVR